MLDPGCLNIDPLGLYLDIMCLTGAQTFNNIGSMSMIACGMYMPIFDPLGQI